MPDYSDPPIHEVILDLRFGQPLESGEIERLPGQLGGTWTPQTISQFELGPSGSMNHTETFSHWIGEEVDRCKWITRVWDSRVTLNSVRAGLWPTGEYVGWPVIIERWSELVARLSCAYPHPITRCGLRYINKLAVPATANLNDWLNVGLKAPELLQGVTNFQLQQSWASIHGFEDLAASISLAMLPNDHLPIPGQVAAVLDIDVFNFKVADSPPIESVRDWFQRAHLAENSTFEACIADSMRESLRGRQLA